MVSATLRYVMSGKDKNGATPWITAVPGWLFATGLIRQHYVTPTGGAAYDGTMTIQTSPDGRTPFTIDTSLVLGASATIAGLGQIKRIDVSEQSMFRLALTTVQTGGVSTDEIEIVIVLRTDEPLWTAADFQTLVAAGWSIQSIDGGPPPPPPGGGEDPGSLAAGGGGGEFVGGGGGGGEA